MHAHVHTHDAVVRTSPRSLPGVAETAWCPGERVVRGRCGGGSTSGAGTVGGPLLAAPGRSRQVRGPAGFSEHGRVLWSEVSFLAMI